MVLILMMIICNDATYLTVSLMLMCLICKLTHKRNHNLGRKRKAALKAEFSS